MEFKICLYLKNKVEKSLRTATKYLSPIKRAENEKSREPLAKRFTLTTTYAKLIFSVVQSRYFQSAP